ncbi:MAG: TIGR03545 family protein [Gemmatimonadetes bacterium]|nr:TIGR03545 family protein [Gemmatimonadota bacterium]
MHVFRWKAIIPLGLLLVLMGAGWYLLLDSAVRRGIEVVGTALVGAKVDLEEADVRLAEGAVILRGLLVTNPDAPMTNLFQLDEVVADLNLRPLLQKKIFIDTIAVRGLRFGTPRATSGAIPNPDPEGGALRRQIDEWSRRVPVPDFSLDGLSGTVNVAAIRPENLQTPALARGIQSAADSARDAWMAQLQALNPTPLIDSARALAERLQGASLRSLGLGFVRSVRSLRTTVSGLTTLRSGIDQLVQDVSGGVETLQRRVSDLPNARAADLASARNLLQIPSLDAPDISPALFTDLALERIQPVLYWARMAERYVPPGLDPRRRPGPSRARRAGSDVEFPTERGYAGLTIAFAEIDLRLEGEGASAGAYRVHIEDFSSEPSVHGRPIRISVSRTEAGSGPDAVHLEAVLDHVTSAIRDSVNLRITGFPLPAVTLPGIGAHMDLGAGVNQLSLVRIGDTVAGQWLWSSSQVSWDRASMGSGRVNDLLWRTLSALRDVQVEVGVSGDLTGPTLSVRSNVASEISRSLRRELATEVAAAERRVRAEVERLVAQPIADARSRVAEVEATVQGLAADYRRQLDQVRADLEARLRDLGRD